MTTWASRLVWPPNHPSCPAADWGLNYGGDGFWNLFCCQDNEPLCSEVIETVQGMAIVLDGEGGRVGWRGAGRPPRAQKFTQTQGQGEGLGRESFLGHCVPSVPGALTSAPGWKGLATGDRCGLSVTLGNFSPLPR